MLTGLEKLQKGGAFNVESEEIFLLIMKWYGYTKLMIQSNNVLNKRTVELTIFFADRNINSCVLKGQGTTLLYPDPTRHQCGNIYLWVDDNRDEGLKLIRKEYHIGDVGIKYIDVDFLEDAPVEIHFNPSYSYYFVNGKRLAEWTKQNAYEQFAQYNVEIGLAFHTKGFNLVYSLLHIYRHLFSEGIGLRQMLDYYYILIHSSAEDRDGAYQVMGTIRMKGFAGAAMYVLHQVFGLSEHFSFVLLMRNRVS